MTYLFKVTLSRGKIKITKANESMKLTSLSISIDNQFIGTISFIDTLVVSIQDWIPRNLLIQADILVNGYLYRIYESHKLTTKQLTHREHNYQAGDILVACDNMTGLPYGYMGHTAIVVDNESIVESVITEPIIRNIPIESFTKDHPIHAHFRPKAMEMGENAAKYALSYLEKFEENKKSGMPNPVFKFALNTPLNDESTYIYCSKLVYLSYFYGAHYEFINDYLWFSPEDLYSNLNNNPDFELIYINPKFTFYIDS
jgi:hypothetical protein